MAPVQRVAVIGAGTMGNGIAQVFAVKGAQVTMVDAAPAALEGGLATIRKSLERMLKKERISQDDAEAALARIQLSSDAAAAASTAELVVEAILEEEGIKREVFQALDQAAPASTILATNTSSISITRIASVTGRPDQVIGMHFMNPVPMMKLVEVIRGVATSDETRDRVFEVARWLDKIPVECNDSPGFVANRVLLPMINEAVFALQEGVATRESIDEIMKLGMAHPMGPLTLADFIGLDVCLSILEVLHRELGDPKYRPCLMLRNMVAAGRLGRKTGRGFYEYE